MATEIDDLDSVKQQLEAVLEDRIGALMAQVQATQELSRQIIAVDVNIKAQEAVRTALEEQIAPLESETKSLESENAALKHRVQSMKDNVGRMRTLKQELMSNLGILKNELNE